ncbi:hypothetical protein GCM10017764_26560 [Sphingobacterium griseoflavum]|uniref:Uncharacterized protein n=2 Tax=Sphingobacterium griseoflavum TaxID=1474952 RepID=A0ABQ3HZ21_9SPHI|nr:hypothetical protein GCM10017764_26560 [Sphingobacterium griseoflavum]
MEIYSAAMGVLKIKNEISLRSIFRHYQEESAAAVKQLTDDLGLDASDLTSEVLFDTRSFSIKSVNDLFSTDVCNVLGVCKSVEELCTQAYQRAIVALDESRLLLSFHIREQAEQQYMASHHINTLLDCNLLNRQAV